MLVAFNEHNERFVLKTSIPPTTLKQLRETTQFYCPQCKEPLQFKIGSVKIPHFSHHSNSICETHFSERESEKHLLGKEHFFEMFQSLSLCVELEPYLPQLAQRPDLLVVKSDRKRYAIEYQCSPISTERLKERNNGYASEDIHPIWIPATPKHKGLTNGLRKISLSNQLQQFLVTTNNQSFLITYDPYKRLFYYVSNLLFVHGQTFLSKVQCLPLEKQKFPFYLPKTLMRNEFLQYMKTYHLTKEKYLKSRVLLSRKGVNDILLRSVYELRLNLSSLPNYIGIPIRGSEELKLFNVEWQTALFYFVQFNGIKISTLTQDSIYQFLEWAKLNKSYRAISVVQEYCNFLLSLSVEHLTSSVSSNQVVSQLYSQFLANKDVN